MIEEIELPAQNYGPGNALRAKREEYEWSIEAVAEALHLSTSSVRAIEADRYEDLPGATYVIGYWRSYARLLGIDIEETIEANKRNLNIVVPEATGYNVNRAHHHKNGLGFLWVGLLLMALAAFGYYTWQQKFFGLLDQFQLFKAEQSVSSSALDVSGNSTQQEPVIKETEVLRPLDGPEAQMVETQMPNALNGAIESPPASMDGGSAEQVTESILRPLENDPASTTAPPPQVSPSMGNLQQGLVLPSGNDNQSTTAPINENVNVNNFLQNQSGVATPNDVATIQPGNNTGALAGQGAEVQVLQSATDNADPVDESTLFLTLVKDSWLDIRDKTNKRLLYRTETAGKQISVKGTPPFYVYIGTPSGVKIKYKGQDVPFETHKSGLFARFKLGDTLESL